MRFNGNGDLVAGVGPLSVNRVQVGTGFNPRWNGNDAFLVNAPDATGVYRLCEGLRESFRPVPVVLPGGVENIGASRIACGAGNFAVEVATSPTPTVYGSWNGDPLPAWMAQLHPLDGDASGRLLFCSWDYTSMVVVAPNGSQTSYRIGANWDLDSARLILNGFCYLDYSKPKSVMIQMATNQPSPSPTVDTAFNPYVFASGGQWWVLYHNQQTYLHVAGDTSQGYLLPASYNPDICVEGTAATVAITPNAGEAPNTISYYPIEVLGQGMGPLVPKPPDPKPPDPKPPDPPKPPVQVKSVVILR